MNLEDYIKDLDPGLQEKARTCGSVEELLALAKEAKVPLSDEALEAIAGGDNTEPDGCTALGDCPKCGHQGESYKHELVSGGYERYYYRCPKCGNEWTVDYHAM